MPGAGARRRTTNEALDIEKAPLCPGIPHVVRAWRYEYGLGQDKVIAEFSADGTRRTRPFKAQEPWEIQ